LTSLECTQNQRDRERLHKKLLNRRSRNPSKNHPTQRLGTTQTQRRTKDQEGQNDEEKIQFVCGERFFGLIFLLSTPWISLPLYQSLLEEVTKELNKDILAALPNRSIPACSQM
jgi:hypothetical protein